MTGNRKGKHQPKPISKPQPNISMPKIIEAIYENGVFKPLQKVNFRPGSKVRIVIQEDKKEILRKYKGVFGKAEVEELREYEGEVML